MKMEASSLLDYREPSAMSDELLNVPGFVNELKDYTLATSNRPNQPLATVGALAMLSHLSGTNYTTADGLSTNLYFAVLADSGMGKDAVGVTNKKLAEKAGILRSIADDIASGEALEDAAAETPTLLLQCDEADYLFGTMKGAAGRGGRTSQMLRRFYSDVHSAHALRRKANTEGSAVIRAPHVSMLAMGIGEHVYRAMSDKSLTDGLLGRCLLADFSGFRPLGKVEKRDLPENCVAAASWMAANDNLNRESAEMQPIVVPYDAEALALKDELAQHCDAVVREAMARDMNVTAALLVRLNEKALKLALLAAISKDYQHPVITRDEILWGTEFAVHITRQMIAKSALYVAEGPFDKMKKRVIGLIKKHGGQIDMTTLQRLVPWDAATIRKIINTLHACDMIDEERLSYRKIVISLKK